MPRTFFYSFIQAIVFFFQWLFALVARLLAPLFYISPLPDSVDLFIICLLIVAGIFLLLRSAPWDK